MPGKKSTTHGKSADKPVRVDRANAAVCASATAPAMLTPTERAERHQDLKISARAALQAFEKTPPIAPTPEEELEVLWSESIREEIERLVALVPLAQRKAFRRSLLKPVVTKKSRGGQFKWTKRHHRFLLVFLAQCRNNGSTLTQAVEISATLYGIGPPKIRAQIKKARDTIPREDLPAECQWFCTPRAKPPRISKNK